MYRRDLQGHKCDVFNFGGDWTFKRSIHEPFNGMFSIPMVIDV
jgi:hypothetical protein